MIAAIGEGNLISGAIYPAAAIKAELVGQDAARFRSTEAEAEITIIADAIAARGAAISKIRRQGQVAR